MALTRLPSSRRASTIGDDSSTRRPTAETILEITRIRCFSSLNRAAVSSSTPKRSTKTVLCELTRTSVIVGRSEEHTSELQSLMRISYAVFCLKKKKQHKQLV